VANKRRARRAVVAGHRITWVREQDEDELAKAVGGEPTVDWIEVATFASQDKLKEWLSQKAPAFLNGPFVAL
jgi:hypothetical protein